MMEEMSQGQHVSAQDLRDPLGRSLKQKEEARNVALQSDDSYLDGMGEEESDDVDSSCEEDAFNLRQENG